MKNPLKNEDHSELILMIAAGALVAGALAYLFLTDSGDEIVKSLKHRLKDKAKELASEVISKKTGVKKKLVKNAADHVAK